MKTYIVFNLDNKHVLSSSLDSINDFFFELNIAENLKNSILERINGEMSFELAIYELEKLQDPLSEKIDELIADVNFDPFKERLRRIYPNQYESDPFIWKGTTYYLYVKLNPIDSQISRVRSFMKSSKEFISKNESMKFTFKN